MRKVMSLSLTEKISKDIKQKAKKRGFESVSAYVKYLVDLDKDVISESELAMSVQEARKDYKAKKSVKANSIEDLL